MKRLLVPVTAGLVAVLSAACDETESSPAEPPADLVVEYSDWNGWDPEHVPEIRHAPLVGAVGEEVTVDALGGITIEVVEVDGDEITIQVSEEMARRKDSGVNLRQTTDTFVAEPGAPATFATPTMDAGWNFEVGYDGEPSPTSPT